MASEFITRVEHDKDEPYTIIFRTDDADKYKAIEDACRYAIGHGKTQFQEVVRCGECIHRYVDGENVRFNVCELNHNKVQADDWYCADGKRKDNETKLKGE